MCKEEKRNTGNLAGMEEREKERKTHNGGLLRNGGGHFELQISAAMMILC